MWHNSGPGTKQRWMATEGGYINAEGIEWIATVATRSCVDPRTSVELVGARIHPHQSSETSWMDCPPFIVMASVKEPHVHEAVSRFGLNRFIGS